MSLADKPIHPVVNGVVTHSDGITLRQFYAGLAMQGILNHAGSYIDDPTIDDIAILSIRHADALIKQLEKTDGN